MNGSYAHGTDNSRYATFVTHPHLDWQYTTVPQDHMNGRVLPYNRGKGLGGSSAINFCFYTRGAKDDFDEWARRVGDDFWNWKNTERRFKKLEGYKPITTESHKQYADWKADNHGTEGPVVLSDSEEWENNQVEIIQAAYKNGWKPNMDVNSGDPIGVGLCATTGYKGKRTTAKTAYLQSPPGNLEILTDSQVTKILFDGKKAIGVTAGGKDCFADKEVLLSAGAIDTPKLLMLSGVGPKAELDKHGIPLHTELPVGIGLQDHVHVCMSIETEEGKYMRSRWARPENMKAAMEQFEKDGTGPMAIMYNSAAVGFDKGSDEVYASQEFKDLPKDVQEYLHKPTVPSYEFAGLIPTVPHPGFDPSKTYQSVMVFGMVPQSRGSVTLKSKDPSEAPICDPNFLSHPWDRRSLIDGVKKSYAWLTSPEVAPKIIGALAAPKTTSDEDVLEFIKNYGVSTWHMCSTAIMGKADDKAAVVTPDLKVKGLENLRIADLSVTPFVPNAHTVSTGYLIGEAAAELLIGEYGLDS